MARRPRAEELQSDRGLPGACARLAASFSSANVVTVAPPPPLFLKRTRVILSAGRKECGTSSFHSLSASVYSARSNLIVIVYGFRGWRGATSSYRQGKLNAEAVMSLAMLREGWMMRCCSDGVAAAADIDCC
uniref:Uncharacterized protein n=1 Tax=Physcomitrium patens TaxID=3218 RepID=A9SM33_PHYPA